MIKINDINEIKNLIPHREPFLFVDRCEIIDIGKEGNGYRKFHETEFFFKGHFPNKPIVPGVILVEAMAQTAGIVVSKQYESYPNRTVLFMSLSKAKFRKPVLPTHEIKFNVKFVSRVKSVFKFSSEAYYKEVKVCEAIFSAMITYK